jgi:glutamine synthetase
MADQTRPSPTISELVRSWEQAGIRYVRFELPDMHGGSRSKIVPLGHVEGYATRGLNMYGGTVTLDSASSVVGGSRYNEEVSYADQLIAPDLETAALVPWEAATARLICDGAWPDGRAQAAAPRQVLKRLLARAADRGFLVRAGLEYEFYILDRAGQPTFGGIHIFNSIRNTYVPVVARILDEMPRAGVDLITANCEYGPSQFEINFASSLGVRAADDGFTFKNGVKAIAHQLGYNATFMTKPFADQSACGCHLHVSLASRETGRNVFLDGQDPAGLSRECRCFIQGMLDHAAASMALMAPTPNCYHRFVPHHFAPSNVSWGIEDRSAMIRAKSSRDENTHLENRAPTALSNPYLAMAAVVAGGLLGLERGQPAETPPAGLGPAEDREGYEPLPGGLDESLAALEADRELGALLGQEFTQVYAAIKRFELKRFRDHVTDWERNEYLELY